MRRVGAFLVAALTACLLLPTQAHAAGEFLGQGSMNCPGGTVWLAAVNVNGTDWVFDVTTTCLNQAPQHIFVAGSWNSATGGPVQGFGTGLVSLGPVNCSSSQSNIPITVAMIASPILTGRFNAIGRLSLGGC